MRGRVGFSSSVYRTTRLEPEEIPNIHLHMNGEHYNPVTMYWAQLVSLDKQIHLQIGAIPAHKPIRISFIKYT